MTTKRPAEARREETPDGRPSKRSRPRRQNMTVGSAWTAADAAELDVLVCELTGGFQQHRELCEACRPEPCPVLAAYRAHEAECWKCGHGIRVATELYGEPCLIRRHWLAHGSTCVRCNPCPIVRSAAAIVLGWRERRQLLTRAEDLRIERAVHALELARAVAEMAG